MKKAELLTASTQIAAQLGETDETPVDQIRRALKHCGPELVQATVQEALAVEAGEGMTVADGSRRRTLGGVFFVLLRQKVSPELWWRIHPMQNPAGPRHEPMAWAARAEAVQAALKQPGEATTAKLVVVGHPTEMQRREGFVIVTVEDTKKKLPTLPRGLPKPVSTATTFKVCVADRQWRKIEASLKKPDDVLIAEGYPFVNEKTGSVIVLAQQGTTKLLQMALRETQKAVAPTPSGPPSRRDGKGQPQAAP
jgi:PHAX RNA-binding domain